MTIARRANAAWERQDFAIFDRLRDLDQAIRNLPTDELEALMADRHGFRLITNTHPLDAA